jgi:hypothetical protein
MKEDEPQCERQQRRKARIDQNRQRDLYADAQHHEPDQSGEQNGYDQTEKPRREKGAENVYRRSARATCEKKWSEQN